jgi:hypothetical protein
MGKVWYRRPVRMTCRTRVIRRPTLERAIAELGWRVVP